jgi:hypothetical protein
VDNPIITELGIIEDHPHWFGLLEMGEVTCPDFGCCPEATGEVFVAAHVEWGEGLIVLSMLHHHSAIMLVIGVEICIHKLNGLHLCNIKYPDLFQDLEVHNHLTCFRGELELAGKATSHGIPFSNLIIHCSSLKVVESKSRGL